MKPAATSPSMATKTHRAAAKSTALPCGCRRADRRWSRCENPSRSGTMQRESSLNSTVVRRIPRWGRVRGWLAGAVRREAPGPRPGKVGRRLRLRRQPRGSCRFKSGRVRRRVSIIISNAKPYRAVMRTGKSTRLVEVPPRSGRRPPRALSGTFNGSGGSLRIDEE